ncbi:MAG TPA: type II toxin-antitoxin system RelE/ParE family toxin [Chthoniobacterales bacterium]|nr:type II toxin-antitoxin system RelE/ParE family toxin [Chthoniobacterales bacterium]
MIIAYEIRRGARFRLIAVGTQENDKIHLPYLDFLQDAQRCEPREWPKLVRIMDHTAEAGPPRDEEKSKPLREGIFEFRTKGGLRQLWFYDEGRVVICVNGYIKQGQKTPNAEIDAAIQWRNKYLTAKQAGTLKEITLK